MKLIAGLPAIEPAALTAQSPYEAGWHGRIRRDAVLGAALIGTGNVALLKANHADRNVES